MHVRDDLIDPERFCVYTEKLNAVGRMHAPGWYCRTHERFDMPRLTFEEWSRESRSLPVRPVLGTSGGTPSK